jgi:hypothetical protein
MKCIRDGGGRRRWAAMAGRGRDDGVMLIPGSGVDAEQLDAGTRLMNRNSF